MKQDGRPVPSPASSAACLPSGQILNGRLWVVVDGAVLDVSSFARRHPGGSRLITNAMGTDVTAEIIGKDDSIGNYGMAFSPHSHTSVSVGVPKCSRIVGQDITGEPEGTEEWAMLHAVDRLGLYRLCMMAAFWMPPVHGDNRFVLSTL